MADSSSSSCPPPTTSEMPSQATQKMSTNSEVIPRDGPPRAVTKIPDHPTQATMYQLLGARLKCTLTDGRIATGTFICLDRLYVSICKMLYDNWKIYGMIVWEVPQCNACGICVSLIFSRRGFFLTMSHFPRIPLSIFPLQKKHDFNGCH